MAKAVETQGVTVEEAIQVALNKLGVSRDRVEIEILHHPRSGLFGIGARRAKVRATLREQTFADGEEFEIGAGRRRRGRRGRRRRGGAQDRGSDTNGKSQKRNGAERAGGEKTGERSGRGGRGRGSRQRSGGRDQRDRSNRERRTEEKTRETQDSPIVVEDDPVAGIGGSGTGVEQVVATPSSVGDTMTQAAARERESAQPATTGEEAPETVAKEPLTAEQVGSRALELVDELLRRMGFEATVELAEGEFPGEVLVRIQCDADGLLIGRHGQTLDSVEHLVNRMVLAGESSDLRVVLDVGGYRERRRDTLLELADRLKVRALTHGRRVQVSPMSPRDRRIFQGALVRDDTVTTQVIGSGFYRRVMIVPVGLDDDAQPIEEVRHDGGRNGETTEDAEGRG